MNVIDILAFFIVLLFAGVLEAILMNEFFKNSINLMELEGENKWKDPFKLKEKNKS